MSRCLRCEFAALEKMVYVRYIEKRNKKAAHKAAYYCQNMFG